MSDDIDDGATTTTTTTTTSNAKPKSAPTQQEKLDDALFNACGTGALELVKQGIKAGGNPATKHAGRHNCLRLATQRAYFHIVRYLVEECSMSLRDDPLIFHYAALGNLKHPTMLAYLKERGADINFCDEKLGTPLTLGMFKGDVDEQFANWLIKEGADVAIHAPSGEKSSALHKAAEFGSMTLIKLLLERGAAVLLDKRDIRDATPLLIAAEHGREDVVELFLVEFKVDPDQFVHYTPLFLATQNGHFGVCKLLVDAGANVDIKDDTHGCTPLHIAASNNHLAIMRLLLTHGATADVYDKRGFTPLLMAATEDYFDAVRLLVQHGAQPSLPGPERVTALHLIASRGQNRMAALLLELGADAHAKDEGGKEPLDTCEPDVRKRMENMFANYQFAFVVGALCDQCAVKIDGKKRCGKCKKAYYCSTDCQRIAWATHKSKCSPD